MLAALAAQYAADATARGVHITACIADIAEQYGFPVSTCPCPLHRKEPHAKQSPI